MKALELIDRVYVVNLPSREDRRVAWVSQLAKLPQLSGRLEFFPAVDGSRIENHTRLRNGELGCSMSHLAVWKQAAENGYRFILVFEDDVLFDVDFEERLNDILEDEPDFDWLYLFNTWDYRPVEKHSDRLFKVIASLGTQAYILQLSAVERLQPFVEEFNYPIDVVMGHMSFLSRVYRPVHVFVSHNEESKSDIAASATSQSLKQKMKRFFKIG